MKKIIILYLLSVLLPLSASADSFMQERLKRIQDYRGLVKEGTQVGETKKDSGGTESIDIAGRRIVIPAASGHITDSFSTEVVLAAAPPAQTEPLPLLIIHIQDAHTNFEAQQNIAKIIDALAVRNRLNLLCVEGTAGEIDTSVFEPYSDKKTRHALALSYIKEGKITGPEYLSITKRPELILFGIEEQDLYDKNLNAFKKSLEFKREITSYLAQVETALNALKARLFNKELLDIHAKALEYDQNAINIEEFVKFLKGRLPGDYDFGGRYPNLNAILSLSDIQRFDKPKSLEIDIIKIFGEIILLQDEVKGRFFKNDDQRRLDELLKEAKILKNLFTVKLSTQEYMYYKNHKGKISDTMFADFINRNDPSFKILPGKILAHLSEIEEFYEAALERETSLLENTLKRIEGEGVRMAALITGGFHTDGITRRLREKKIAHIVIAPITTQETDEEIYIRALLGE